VRGASPPSALPLVGFTVSFRGSAPPRSAVSASGAPPLPSPSRDSAPGSSAEKFPAAVVKPSRTSREVRLPFRVLPGCTARLGSRRFPAGSHRRIGSASPGVLRPYGALLQGARVFRDRRSRPREARAASPSPVPPSGFLSPSAGSAASPRRSSGRPGPPLDGARPGTLRPCFMPQRPWDSPFRAFPSRRAVPPFGGLLLPCGFDVDSRPARRLRFVARAFRRAPPGEPRGRSVRAHAATGWWDWASRSRRDRPSPHELPRTARGTTDRSHRARRPRAVPPASKLCSLRESVHATGGTRSELAPEPRDPLAGPLLSWGSRPSGACPTTSPGPCNREDTRRTEHPRRNALRSGRQNASHDPET
jgi:hypothetical protein